MGLLLFIGKMMTYSSFMFVFYWLFLRNRPDHFFNRMFILSIPILSLFLPFLKFSMPIDANPVPAVFFPAEGLNAGIDQVIKLTGKNAISQYLLTGWLLIIYFLVVSYKIGQIGWSVIKLERIKRASRFIFLDNTKIYLTTAEGTPFTYRNSIFFESDSNFNEPGTLQILLHEKAHLQQSHTRDLVFLELVEACCWINPIFYLIKNELKVIHEFLADAEVISKSDRFNYAELLLVKAIEKSNRIKFQHSFFQSHIKRRLKMITSTNCSRAYKPFRFLIIPVLILLVLAFSKPSEQAQHQANFIFQIAKQDSLNIVKHFLKTIVWPKQAGNREGEVYFSLKVKDGKINDLKFISSDMAKEKHFIELVAVKYASDPIVEVNEDQAMDAFQTAVGNATKKNTDELGLVTYQGELKFKIKFIIEK